MNDLDLDDEDAFFAKLESRMKAQAARGIELGKDNIEENTHTGFRISRKPFIEPVPQTIEYDKPPLTKFLAVGDLETDPFAKERIPAPFCAGAAFHDSLDLDTKADCYGWYDYYAQPYVSFWGDDCVQQLFEYLVERELYMRELYPDFPGYVIYYHNGGKFDFNYFGPYLEPDTKPFFIDTRIVKTAYAGIEHRDSYSLIPVPLKKFQNNSGAKKLEIEYWKMERLYREQHKSEILEYLEADCITLLDALRDFISRFGWRLTIAGTATPYIAHFHGFDCMDAERDAMFRPYFKGGRVQCFETGIIVAPEGKSFLMVDANSMYPAAMSNFMHPVSVIPKRYKDIRPDTDFVDLELEYNAGCLGAGEGLEFDFRRERGRFLATMHEINAGIETKTIRIKKIYATYSFAHKVSFREFVSEFYRLRTEAKASGDVSGTEFYKLVMNSGYGRFAMNTTGYKDYLVNPASIPTPLYSDKVIKDAETGKVISSPNGWRLVRQDQSYTIWARPARGAGERFVNVATAASITGAARSVLWRAICASERPLYCDTDSIICEQFNGDMDDKRLGAWKVEARGDAVAIAGKKMYAFLTKTKPSPFDPAKHEEITYNGVSYYLLKKAHKGVQLTGKQIVDVCGGAVIEHESEAPTFKLDGSILFQKRRIRMTGGNPVEQLEMF